MTPEVARAVELDRAVLLAQAVQDMKAGRTIPKKEMEANPRLWLHELLPKHFRSADDNQFASHHDKFFNWGWSIKRGVLPSPAACLWIVNRAGNKSTSVAGLTVSLGARQRRKFGLVITRTETQGDTHIRRINSMLLGSNIGKYYPEMARPQVREINKRNVQSAWNRTQLTTDAGWTLQSFSLQAAQRGVGLEEYRPDFIWITDVDDENDGPGMVDTLMDALSASCLGTGSSDCMIIFDQNLIHRDSCLNRILTHKSDVLSDRLPIGPISALQHPKYERRNDHWYVTEGVESWRGLPVAACEGILNKVGMDSWEREYQHNITLAYADSVYGMWDEVFHVITRSEFAAYFENQGLNCHDQHGWRLPAKGKIVMAQDWGNNPNHPCANRWAWRPPEGMPREVARDVFFYRERCWPRFPLVEDDDRKHPSPMTVGQAIQDIEKPWGEDGFLQDGTRRMQWRIASHERPEIVRGYQIDLPMTGRPPLHFSQINTARARAGIVHMRDFLTVDMTKFNPFRRYPQGHEEAGKRMLGKPRVWFVVDDLQGELYWDAEQQKLAVAPAVDEEGQARTRFEYPNYRKPDTADGAERKDPPKIDDDMIDCDRAIAGDLFPKIEPLSFDEQVEAALPKKAREARDKGASDEGAQLTAYTAYAEAKAKVKEKTKAQEVKGYVPMKSRLRQRWRQN